MAAKSNKIIREHIKKHLYFPITFPLRIPRIIVIFVTSKCNALCDHCFRFGLPGVKRRQMSKENILHICKSINRSADISLTGGEPFLRNDLKALIDKLMRLKFIRSISINSNGSFPDKIESICREICQIHKKPLCLNLSLDGLSKTHNSIRKIPDGFNKVLDTYERAKRIGSLHPQFGFGILITIMRQNIAEIEKLVSYLEERGYNSGLNIVRGNSFSTFGVPQDILNPGYNPQTNVIFDVKEVDRLLKRISKSHPRYIGQFSMLLYKTILNTILRKKRLFSCYAGYEDAVVYSGGDIGICEQVKPFGNLAKWNWNFQKAWNSQEAMEQRSKLTTCSCGHFCNLKTSIEMLIEQHNYKQNKRKKRHTKQTTKHQTRRFI